MTTERSGMSLEKVRNWHRMTQQICLDTANSYPSPDTVGDMYLKLHDEHKEMADAIDAHLSRDAVGGADDVDSLHQLACEYGDTDEAGTGYDFSMEQFEEFAKAVVSSFAARHAAVPDAMVVKLDEGTVMGEYSSNGDIVTGWNAYRKALLAQRDGG